MLRQRPSLRYLLRRLGRKNKSERKRSRRNRFGASAERVEARTLLTTLTSVSVSGGDLIVEDTASENEDTLLISTDSSGFVITDTSGNNLSTSIATATGDGTPTINVPFTEVTGTQVLVQTAGMDDEVTIDAACGPGSAINVNIDTGTGNDTVRWGSNQPLNSITVLAETIELNGDTQTTADQVWNGPVRLNSDSTLTSTNGGTIAFESTLDGARNLTINTSGETVFEGNVGADSPIQSLTTDAAGTTLIGEGATWMEAGLGPATFTFNDPVILGEDVVILDNGSGVYFNNTVDGAHSLVVQTGPFATTRFNGEVGGTTPLARLDTSDSSLVEFNGSSVTTSGDQEWGTLSLSFGGKTFEATDNSSNVRFRSTVDGFAFITVNAKGETLFEGTVGAIGILSLTTDAAGTTVIGSGTTLMQAAGASTFHFRDPVTLEENVTISDYGGSGVFFHSTLDGAHSLTVNAGATTYFGGAVGGTTPLASITIDAGGVTEFDDLPVSGPNVRTTGAIDFGDAVAVTGVLNIDSGGGVTFDDRLDGHDAAITISGGRVTFEENIGDEDVPASLNTSDASSVEFNGNAATTSGDQEWGALELWFGDATFEATAAGANIRFRSTIDGPADLFVNTMGETSFEGDVGDDSPIQSLTTDAAGTTLIGEGATWMEAGLGPATFTFNDPVILGEDVVILDNGSGVYFNSTLDGAHSLVVQTGPFATTRFDGDVGGTTPLASLDTTGSSSVEVNGSSVTTSGVQEWGALSLSFGLKTFEATGANQNIRFRSTIDGLGFITVNADGETSFEGAVGATIPISSLTTDAVGTTVIGAGTTSMVAAATSTFIFNDPVTLEEDVTISDIGGTGVFFESTLDGAQSLTVDAGATTRFNGEVGGTTPLSSLSVRSNTIDINAPVAGTGTLSLAPKTPGRTIGIGTGDGGLTLNANELSNLVDGFSLIVIGAAGVNGEVELVDATFLDAVTIVGPEIHVSGLDAGTNSVNLISTGDGIFDADTNGSVDVTGGAVLLSGQAIGSANNSIEVSTLALSTTATAPSVDQFLAAVDVATIVNLSTGGGTLTLTDGTFILPATTGQVDASQVNLNGATLSGNGTLSSSLTVGDGGTVAPGTSPGTLTVDGDVTFESGSTLAIEIDGTGVLADKLQIIGPGRTVSLGGARLLLSGSYTPSTGDSFTPVDLTASDSTLDVSNTFLDLKDGAEVIVGGAVLTIDYETGTDSNDVKLDSTLLIGGRLWHDLDGDGIEDMEDLGIDDITVRLLSSDGNTELDTTATQDGGLYRFLPTSPGTYVVEFSLPNGFNFTSQDAGTDDQNDSDVNANTGRVSVTLQAGSLEIIDVDAGVVFIDNLGQIGDFVWNDENFDGFQDEGEPGIEDVEVRLLNSSLVVEQTITTDEDGHYVFHGLVAGTYFVEFVAKGGYEFSPQDALVNSIAGDETDSDANVSTGRTEAIVLATNQVNVDVDAGLAVEADRASVSGFVWSDRNSNGIQDPGERGRGGVVMYLYDSNGQVQNKTRTDDDGNYIFDGLEEATFEIRVGEVYGHTLSPANRGDDDELDSDFNTATGRVVVQTQEDTATTSVDAGVRQIGSNGTIGGNVWYDSKKDGVRRNEKGIPDVRVELWATNRKKLLHVTTTDKNGRYRFGSLLPGEYLIRIVARNGFRIVAQDVGTNDKRDSDVNPGTGRVKVTLTENQRLFNVSAGLEKLPIRGAIQGEVWYDRNSNGIRHPHYDKGLSGFIVYLYDSRGTRGLAKTLADSSGRYSFGNLKPGNYVVEVRPFKVKGRQLTLENQGTDETRDSDFDRKSRRTTVTVVAGEVTEADAGYIIDLNKASIGNRVWIDENENGLQDPGEPGKSGVDVVLYDRKRRKVLRTTTNSSGGYRFDGLSAGTYIVRAFTPDGFDITQRNVGTDDRIDSDANRSGYFLVTVLANQRLGKADIGLDPIEMTSVITGTAWNDDNDGIRQPDEGPAVGAEVVLRDSQGAEVIASTTTDENGDYRFEGLTEGTYVVEFGLRFGDEFVPQNLGSDDTVDSDFDDDGRLTIAIREDEEVSDVDIGFFFDPATAKIGNYVWEDSNENGIQDDTEQGVGSVTVRLLDEDLDEIATTLTNAEGFYEFDGLNGANYFIEVVRPAGFRFSPANTVANDQLDSDVDAGNGRIAVTLSSGEVNHSIAAGLIDLPRAVIGNKVWFDVNGDGIRSSIDRGRDGIIVRLFDDAGVNVLARTVTRNNGFYAFRGLEAGTYVVEVDPTKRLVDGKLRTTPLTLSPANQGSSDLIDSDFDQTTGRTTITVGEDEVNLTVDAALSFPRLGSLQGIVWQDNGDGRRKGANEHPNHLPSTLRNLRVQLLNGNRVVQETLTNKWGIYTFASVPVGDYRVRFLTPITHKLTQKDVGSGPNADKFDSDANANGVVAVRVNSNEDVRYVAAGFVKRTGGAKSSVSGYLWLDKDKDGRLERGERLIKATPVHLRDATGRVVRKTTTSNGFYSFTRLRPGSYTVVVPRINGAAFTLKDVGSDKRDSDVNTFGLANITLGPNQKARIDAGFKRGAASDFGVIGNRVWFDKDKDGKQDKREPGFKNIQVRLFDATGSRLLRTTRTDANGLYRFAGLPVGRTFVVQVSVPGGFTLSPADRTHDSYDSDFSPVTRRATVVANSPKNRNGTGYSVDAGLFHSSGSIGDRVWEDRNGDGLQSPGEPGIEGVTVLLLDDRGEVLTDTTTDEDGYYAFGFTEDEGTGDYTIQFVPSLGYEFTTAGAGTDDGLNSDADPDTGEVEIRYVGGTVVSGIDAGLVRSTDESLGAISNFIWNDLDGDGVQDEGEPGVDGVELTLRDADEGNILATATTREGGFYSFRGLAEGDYILEMSPPMGYDVTLLSQGTDNALDSDFDPDTLQIEVTLTEGQIETSIDAGLVWRTSGDIGQIRDRVWHDLNDDGLQDDGEPGVPGVTVRLVNDEDGEVLSTITTDANGNYAFNGLGAGTYVIEVQPTGGFEFTGLDAGTDDNVDSDIDPDSGFSDAITISATDMVTNIDAGLTTTGSEDTGVISDFVFVDSDGDGIQDDGEIGLEDVTVRLWSDDLAEFVGSTTTDADGKYTFAGLSPDDYRIEVIAPVGYQYSAQDAGTDDAVDSDVNSMGITGTITLAADQQIDSVDAGLVFNDPSRLLVSTALRHIVPGDDPDGSGQFLSVGHDAFADIEAAVEDDPANAVVLELHADQNFGDVTHDKDRETRVDASNDDITLDSVNITNGTFGLVDGTLGVTNSIQVGDGGVLGGGGTIQGDISVGAGGSFAPGFSTAVTAVDNGTVTFDAGSSFDIEVNGLTAGTEHDQLSLINGGDVVISAGVELNITLGFTPDVDDVFTIVDNTEGPNGGGGVTGTFAGLPDNAEFTADGYRFRIDYDGGDGDDVTLTVLGLNFAVAEYDFTLSEFTTVEGNATKTTTVVMVTRSEFTLASTSVDVVLTGTSATGGTDFTTGPITVTFNAGETTKAVPIEILGDTDFETNETIELSFTNFTPGGQAGSLQPTSAITITNDDALSVGITVVDRTMYVVGTANADQLILQRRSSSSYLIRSNFVGTQLVDPSTFDNIHIQLGDGNDRFTALGNFEQPLIIDGGEGNDRIYGSRGSDVLLGGPGNDYIRAGSGNNIMIGGDGRDTLFGGSGSDILIAGTTAFDDSSSALAGLQAEWNHPTRSLHDRVRNLSDYNGNGGGLNGTNYLKSTGAGQTVNDDTVRDLLFGGGNIDWLFFAQSQDVGYGTIGDLLGDDLEDFFD